MRFSDRTNWNTEESELARAQRQHREAGRLLFDLTASNPTRCAFHYPTHLLNALTETDGYLYDPQPRGLLRAREAVCAYYASHGATLDPAQIVLTTSTSEAYSFLFRLLCEPGSEVLNLQPGYPLFDYLAALDDVHLKPVTLLYDHGWQIDPAAIRRAITPKTRAIVLVHPNNPTGHFTKAWEAEELAAICREFDLSLVVDEVFLDYAFTEKAWTFAQGLENVPVFVVSGLSKIAGLPQMKAAWIAATGPGTQGLERLEVIADTFLSMNTPVQQAIPRWLETRGHIQQQILQRVQLNLAELDQQLKQVPALKRLKIEGGWYAVLRAPAVQPDEKTVLELLDRFVWIHPGYFFGMPDSGWLVASLLTNQLEFRAGVTGLVNYFNTNQLYKNIHDGDQPSV